VVVVIDKGEKRDPKVLELEFGRETMSMRFARWKLLFSEFTSVGHGSPALSSAF
jgi:hypothetical protein